MDYNPCRMSAYDRMAVGTEHVRFWGNSGHAAMSTAGSLNELFQTEKFFRHCVHQ
jgi:hypothetical protein